MDELNKPVKFKKFEINFTKNEYEWFGKVDHFGEFESIEFSIDLRTNSFTDNNWEKLPAFFDFLDINLKIFIQKSIQPLISFATHSNYFSSRELENLEPVFLNWVQILDNIHTAFDSKWKFELEFEMMNNEEPIDTYGRWIITFSGICISGIRRIDW